MKQIKIRYDITLSNILTIGKLKSMCDRLFHIKVRCITSVGGVLVRVDFKDGVHYITELFNDDVKYSEIIILKNF